MMKPKQKYGSGFIFGDAGTEVGVARPVEVVAPFVDTATLDVKTRP